MHNLLIDFARLIEQRASLAVLMHHFQRGIHHLLNIFRRIGLGALEQLDRYAPIPDSPMGRALHGLVLRSKQGFDLIVGRVDRPGPSGFVLALAGKFQCGFGEGGFVFGVHGRLAVDRGFGGHARYPGSWLSG